MTGSEEPIPGGAHCGLSHRTRPKPQASGPEADVRESLSTGLAAAAGWEADHLLALCTLRLFHSQLQLLRLQHLVEPVHG